MRSETISRQNAQDDPTPAVRVSTPPIRIGAAVVLPTLNEELGLERTLSELPFDRFGDLNYGVQPIVIDGGSTDGTLAVARRWNVPVLLQTTKGKGAAVLEAMDWVRRQGIPHAVVLDADATYPTEAIVPALNLLREGSDLVLGVRRPVGGPPAGMVGLLHRIGNIVISYAASVFSGRTVLDICSGFWGVSTEKFHELRIGSAEFAIEAELVLKAIKSGLQVTQIPIDYRERIGEAKIHTVRDGGSIFLSVLEFARRPRRPTPIAFFSGVPAREILSIGLIAQSRTAILECRPSEFQLANRIGLLLRRGLPEADVRVRPTATESGPSEVPTPSPSGRSLFVGSLVAGEGTPAYSVSIRPIEKEITIRLSGATSRPGVGLDGAEELPPHRRRLRRLPGFRYFAILGAVTTRMNFDPKQQQQTMLNANGFRVVSVASGEGAAIGGAT